MFEWLKNRINRRNNEWRVPIARIKELEAKEKEYDDLVFMMKMFRFTSLRYEHGDWIIYCEHPTICGSSNTIEHATALFLHEAIRKADRWQAREIKEWIQKKGGM